MTKLGCPMAQPRLTRRPSASRMMFLPFFKVNRSTCGLMFVFVLQFSSSHLTWGGTSKSRLIIKDSILKSIFCKKLKVYLDLAVKVTNVANNGVVLHLKGNFV